jgi:cytochrome oxidase Cu insertion factor (SCO1/SenC/PrrC family)
LQPDGAPGDGAQEEITSPSVACRIDRTDELFETARMGLEIGDPAPDFELRDHSGRLIRLRDFRGKSSVVLAFFVYANTPG